MNNNLKDILMLMCYCTVLSAFSCCCHSERDCLGTEESDSTSHNFAPCQRKSHSTHQLVAHAFFFSFIYSIC